MIKVTVILVCIYNLLNGQTGLTADLSTLFGGLPMDLPVRKIIAMAEKNKNFKGSTHYNLDLSYSGEIKTSKFFVSEPSTRFFEIVANASELFPDSSLSNVAFFSFDAGYKTQDSLLLDNEFKRICTLFSKYFQSAQISSADNITYFYQSTHDKRPTLTVFKTDIDCYGGGRCIKFTYFRDNN